MMATKQQTAFARNLRRLRKAAGLTTTTAAASVGVTEQTWGAWERGASSPESNRLPAIAAALCVEINELFGA